MSMTIQIDASTAWIKLLKMIVRINWYIGYGEMGWFYVDKKIILMLMPRKFFILNYSEGLTEVAHYSFRATTTQKQSLSSKWSVKFIEFQAETFLFALTQFYNP